MSPEQRREAIIEATVPLVRQRGLNISTRQIAAVAGIAEGTIFRVFDDKEALLRQAVRAALDTTPAERQLREIDLDAPLAERVENAARVLAERMTSIVELATVVGWAELPHDDDDERLARYAWMDALLTRIFSPDADALTCEPDEAARLLKIIAFGGAHPRLASGRPLTPARIADLLLNGIMRHPDDGTRSTDRSAPC